MRIHPSAIAEHGARLKWIGLTALIVFNLATQSWGQSALEASRGSAGNGPRQPVAQHSGPVSSGLAFFILAGAGLAVVSGARARRRRSHYFAPAADFEMAFRLQHAPRKRIDRTPLFRDGTAHLRRTASAFGYDH